MQTPKLHVKLAQALHLHVRCSRHFFRDFDITIGQPRILEYLAENDGCIQRDVAEHCNLKPATITSVLSGMEKAGFIERKSSPADRRILRVFLTDKGRSAVDNIYSVFNSMEEVSFKCFSDSEKETFSRLLTKMIDNLCEFESTAKQKTGKE